MVRDEIGCEDQSVEQRRRAAALHREEPTHGIGSVATARAQDGRPDFTRRRSGRRSGRRSEFRSKIQNGDVVIGDRLLPRNQSLHLANGDSKARRYRFAQVDQRNHVQRGFIGSGEAPEIANHEAVVHHRKIRLGQGRDRTIVSVGGEECNPDLRDDAAVRRQV